MSFYDAVRIGASGAGDYEVERSLRFNDNDTAYLSRNFGTGGNRKKWTFSAWIKRGNLGGAAGEMRIFGGSTNASHIFFTSNDALTWDVAAPGSSASANLTTEQLFRDPSAWFHLVCAFDTDNSTANNRMRIYINGTEITSFGTRTNPSSGYAANAINADAFADGDRSLHTIGYRTSVQGSAGMEFDGYMAEINFIDGQQYDPSYFGETNSDTGQWNPKKYVGGYGTTGFYLPLSDNSGTTATTLGKDSSGNGNNFTPNNFSVAAGSGNDSVIDTPTNNFPTLNPLTIFGTTSPSLSNGNLDFTMTSNNMYPMSTFLIPKSGKWYAEVVFTAGGNSQETVIVSNPVLQQNSSGASATHRHNAINYYNTDIRVDDSDVQSSLTAVGLNTTIGICVDRDAGTVLFKNNNSNVGSAVNLSAAAGSTEDLVFAVGRGSSSGNNISGHFNFGQRPFTYTPPAGFKALNSQNLPDPTIMLPSQHFNTLLWTGNDSADRDITGVGFQPDWLWIKNRSQADFHCLQDSVRGANKILYSNDTDNEQTDNVNGHVNSFLPDGFNVTAGASGNVNENNENYVGWNWNAGDTDGATYRVVVVSDSGNKYRFRNSANTATFAQSAVTLNLAEGGTYTFDGSDSTMASHPIKLSTTANGTHGGGSSYNTGVTYELDGSTVTESAYVSGYSSATSRKLIITVAASAPTLYYYCHVHSGMGGQINTNSTLGSSNFDGSIQTTVKANTSAGFSIVTYTGNGSAGATIGHGLGVKPDAILIKRRDAGDNWMVYHNQANAGVDPEDYYGELNSTSVNINSTIMLNDTAPTSTSITLGGDTSVNGSSATYICYVFSEVAGYSKFNIYFGNFNANGPMVYTRFKPAWLMTKQFGNDNWYMVDNKRDPFNVMDHRLFADVSSAEGGVGQQHVDFLSNGFKWRKAKTPFNNTFNYIYFCFAEAPFKNSRAR